MRILKVASFEVIHASNFSYSTMSSNSEDEVAIVAALTISSKNQKNREGKNIDEILTHKMN